MAVEINACNDTNVRARVVLPRGTKSEKGEHSEREAASKAPERFPTRHGVGDRLRERIETICHDDPFYVVAPMEAGVALSEEECVRAEAA